jgi:hypothetical protein
VSVLESTISRLKVSGWWSAIDMAQLIRTCRKGKLFVVARYPMRSKIQAPTLSQQAIFLWAAWITSQKICAKRKD